MKVTQKQLMRFSLGLGVLTLSTAVLAGGGAGAGAGAGAADTSTLGGMATSLVNEFDAIGKLMIGTAYVAGLGFGISAIFKFKQHKDNPTQVPVGTPFALLAISVLLVFLPSLYAPAGKSIFGDKQVGGGTAGTGLESIPGQGGAAAGAAGAGG